MTKPTAAIAPDALTELDALIAEFATVRFGTGKSWKWANRAFNALAAMRAATGPEDAELCRLLRRTDREFYSAGYGGNAMGQAATRIKSLSRENAGLRRMLEITELACELNDDALTRAEKAERENAAIARRLTEAERDAARYVHLRDVGRQLIGNTNGDYPELDG